MGSHPGGGLRGRAKPQNPKGTLAHELRRRALRDSRTGASLLKTRNRSCPVRTSAGQRNRAIRAGAEFNRQDDSLVSVLRLEDTEVKVWAAGKPRAARASNDVASMDALADFDQAPTFFEMAVVGQCAVIVSNQDVIIEGVK